MSVARMSAVLVLGGLVGALILPGVVVGEEGGVGAESGEIKRPALSELGGEKSEQSIDMGMEAMDGVEGESTVERVEGVGEVEGMSEWGESGGDVGAG